MYTVIKFHARYKRNGLKFTAFDYRPRNPGIEKIVMESPDGEKIKSTVHVAHAANRKEAEAHAAEVLRAGLDRISFFHGAAIEDARIVGGAVASGHSDSLRRVSSGILRHSSSNNPLCRESCPTSVYSARLGNRRPQWRNLCTSITSSICCLAISSTMSKSLLDKRSISLRNTSTVEAADALCLYCELKARLIRRAV